MEDIGGQNQIITVLLDVLSLQIAFYVERLVIHEGAFCKPLLCRSDEGWSKIGKQILCTIGG